MCPRCGGPVCTNKQCGCKADNEADGIEHKIAEALGLVRSDKMMRCPVTYPNLGQNLITTAYCWLAAGEPFCAVDNFEVWLASPAGEKAVEKRVRELSGWVVYEFNCIGKMLTKDNRHRVEVGSGKVDGDGDPIDRGFFRNTEAEAWAAALIWLAERSK